MPMLTDLAAACRKSGLRVVELPGWQHRARPASTGGFAPRGVLCHHTGSATDSRAYVDWMALTGRSDLPAPLCQIALGHDSVVYVCAAGRSNHGGTARATGPMPAGDANSLYVGIEALNSGSEGWSSTGTDAAGRTLTQREGYARLCAALCAHYGWPAAHVRSHKETSVTGKWDPGLLDMDAHRRAVAALIATPTAPRGFVMDKQATAAFKAVNDRLDKIETYLVDKKGKVDTKRFREERARGAKAEDLLEQVLAQLEADASGEARGR